MADTGKLLNAERITELEVPIAGKPGGKDLLSIGQLDAEDFQLYLREARAAERLNLKLRHKRLLPNQVLKVVMQQASTRTGGSMETAMQKLGGSPSLYSGMETSSEAKGESREDTWVAFATQANIIGTRTKEEYGPHLAAHAIDTVRTNSTFMRDVPVINLGDGRNEHPTQALGDIFTIAKQFDHFEDLSLTIVGDQERYRAHHSLMLAAAALGMNVTAVQSPVAPVPQYLVDRLGDRLQVTGDLDESMKRADVLYIGRNPDEYSGGDMFEMLRSEHLAAAYQSWIIDYDRLQQMPAGSIVMHPRPRRDELHPSVDTDPRMRDVQQMENMIAMRMAIIALHLGVSIEREMQPSWRRVFGK